MAERINSLCSINNLLIPQHHYSVLSDFSFETTLSQINESLDEEVESKQDSQASKQLIIDDTNEKMLDDFTKKTYKAYTEVSNAKHRLNRAVHKIILKQQMGQIPKHVLKRVSTKYLSEGITLQENLNSLNKDIHIELAPKKSEVSPHKSLKNQARVLNTSISMKKLRTVADVKQRDKLSNDRVFSSDASKAKSKPRENIMIKDEEMSQNPKLSNKAKSAVKILTPKNPQAKQKSKESAPLLSEFCTLTPDQLKLLAEAEKMHSINGKFLW